MRGKSEIAATLGYAAVIIWVIFTVSLSAWWAFFAWHQVDAMMLLDGEHAQRLARYQRMLFWEGSSLFLSLTGGGAALAYLIFKERKAREKIREFFASFAHELKTPISAIRLQAEVLDESLQEPGQRKAVHRLLSDIGRLYFRLENSLFLSSEGDSLLVMERLRLSELFKSLEDLWPDLSVVLQSDCMVFADRRALEVIVGNIFQNAVTHGSATRIKIDVSESQPGILSIVFHDNGTGYNGDDNSLGKPFSRPFSHSGSGIGLFLVRTLCEQLSGHVSFQSNQGGFMVSLSLQGELAA